MEDEIEFERWGLPKETLDIFEAIGKILTKGLSNV